MVPAAVPTYGWFEAKEAGDRRSNIGLSLSTGYPARVHDLLPDVKLIVILRNPVDRAYSHYHHAHQRDIEPFGFEAAIDAETERLRPVFEAYEQGLSPKEEHTLLWHSYLQRGYYVEQLERWFSYFDREQMLILNSRDLSAEPAFIVKQTLSFIGIDDPSVDMIDFSERRRVGKYPPMSPEIRQRLLTYFKPHNERLYQLLDRDFGWNE